MGYKSIDGLMRHLRDSGIDISGSVQKRQLINTGYFHGYKGYRFFKVSTNTIPFASYSDLNSTIKYDSDLKSLLYSKVMFIETAVKSIALERIMKDAGSKSIQDMYRTVIAGFSNLPAGANADEKKKAQANKLKLESNIQYCLSRAYGQGNVKITHFYNNMIYSDVPLWALFEIMTLGDFAYLCCAIIKL